MVAVHRDPVSPPEPPCSSFFERTTMNAVNLYCCRDGDYLLSPECMQPSLQANASHGPIRFLGSIACLTLGEDLCRDVERQIDERMFALVAHDRIDLRLLQLDDHPVGRRSRDALA
jgi:hypothetical protein